MTQLLLLEKSPAPPQAQARSLDNSFYAVMRKEARDFLICLNYVNGTRYAHFSQAPLSALKATRAFLSPGFYAPKPDPMLQPLLPTSEVKLYKTKTALTKQRTRCTKVLNKLKKTIPLFWIEEAQAKLLTNPEYYGLCVLPAEQLCSINPGQRLGWITTESAIARENEFRKRGID
jgi:hypothetical protein